MRVFIDAVNGDDNTGNGSRKNPYKTLNTIYKRTITEDVTIILKDGTYMFYNTFVTNSPPNIEITIIGTGINTQIKINQNASYWNGIGTTTSSIKFNRLIFDFTDMPMYYIRDTNIYWTIGGNRVFYMSPNYYYMRIKCKLTFNNVLFNNIKTSSGIGAHYIDNGRNPAFSYNDDALPNGKYFFDTTYNSIILNNCMGSFSSYSAQAYISSYYRNESTTITASKNFIGQTNDKVSVSNSFGVITGNMSNWTVCSNNIFNTTKLDGVDDTYRLIFEEYNRKRIGLYCGNYPWVFANYLIWMDNKYFSPQNSYYNTGTLMYNEITLSDIATNGVDEYVISDLYDFTHTIVTIGDESFCPIDKFDNFKIVSIDKNYVYANGIKSNEELIVQTFDINPTSVKSINSIDIASSVSEDSTIKFVFSQDTGETWQTIENDTLTFTDCVIPRKSYDDMSQMEKDSYTTALETIKEKGIALADFQKIDFNSLKLQRLRFAYVINRNNYLSTSNITEVLWNYEDKDYLRELRDSEYVTDVFEHVVKLKSNITNPKLVIQMVL